MNVGVFYHFYPHYRKGVIEALSDDREIRYSFFAGVNGVGGIREHKFSSADHFVALRTFRFRNFVVQPWVIWLCMRCNFDCFIFLADPNHLTTWIGALICRVRRRRVIFWGHGFKSDRQTWKNTLRKVFFKLSNAFFTYGYRAKLVATKLGFDSTSIYVGFNSLDYDKQLAVRKSSLGMQAGRRDSGVLNIVCISRITAVCRYDVLIDAVVIAQSVGHLDIRVTIIGDGPELSALRSRAQQKGVQVDFVGAVYDEQKIASYLFDADLTVSPGKVGLTAMHSLMYGAPVISNSDFVAQMPEVEAIVSGFTGELFERDDVQDLADKLLTFKVRYPDRDVTRDHCFRMMDAVYNPSRQAEIMRLAVLGSAAPRGDDASRLFGNDA